jgi:hypothetical protein
MSKTPDDAEATTTTRVTLEIALRPTLPIEELEKLNRLAEAQGTTVEALILRGIREVIAA